MKKLFLSLVATMIATVSFAQIGYQVSLLNTATGEPRANEPVSCSITLTDASGNAVYTGTQSATSNDFGVVSLNVGNATMFKDMDWSKLPLFIEVSVDGKLIGKSQVLSVPVAEYAKKTGVLTYDNIGTKKVLTFTSQSSNSSYSDTWTFNGHQAKFEYRWKEIAMGEEYTGGYTCTGTCYIEGNMVFGVVSGKNRDSNEQVPFIGHYSEESDIIYVTRYNR